MQKIKFDFEATKERIYAPNSNVPIGAPVDINGNIANDGNAYGIVLCKETENEKYWVRYNLVVMVAGYCDIIDAQEIWGDEYSAEAKSAMSDIIFCDDHKIGGGGWPSDLPKPSVGGYGYTDENDTVHKIDEKYLPASGGAMVVVNCNMNPQTQEIELTDDAVEVLDKINADFVSGTVYPVMAIVNMSYGDIVSTGGYNLCGYGINPSGFSLAFSSSAVNTNETFKEIVVVSVRFFYTDGEWSAQFANYISSN